uniref:Uncharacterized protein n=1 Tax=Romanomermis culicivorax TaxID=13658 RepID=A0A915L4Q0_ROMCU
MPFKNILLLRWCPKILYKHYKDQNIINASPDRGVISTPTDYYCAEDDQNSEGRCNDIWLALTYHKVDSIIMRCSNGGHCAMDNTCFCDGCKPVKRAKNAYDVHD